jgi:hypothetical protein
MDVGERGGDLRGSLLLSGSFVWQISFKLAHCGSWSVFGSAVFTHA